MSWFKSRVDPEFNKLTTSEKRIINEVWEHRTDYIKWPTRARLLWPGCIRVKYHQVPDRIKEEAKSRGVQVDSRSNGPAIMSFLLAGGKRPIRSNGQGWHIDHVYDKKFPWPTRGRSLHAVKDGRHFTQSAGLVARAHGIGKLICNHGKLGNKGNNGKKGRGDGKWRKRSRPFHGTEVRDFG